MLEPRSSLIHARSLPLIAFAATLVSLGGCSMREADYSGQRTSQISATGATLLKLDVGAGYLRVDGRRGTDEVITTGVAHAASLQALDAVQFVTSRVGDTIFVKCVIPPRTDTTNAGASLDVDVQVPSTLALDVVDSSGESVFRNTAAIRIVHGEGGLNVDSVSGNLDITDGGGDLILSHVNGDVNVVDASGSIYVSRVTGSVRIPRAGSGEIQAVGISGDFVVGSKRSGEVAAREIGGSLSVRANGSGSIEYRDVSGKVSLAAGEHH